MTLGKSNKALFISGYLTAASLGLVWAVYQLWLEFDWRWVGVVASLLPALAFFIWVFVMCPARTSANLPLVRRLTLAGAALTLVFGFSMPPSLIALVLSLGVGVGGLYLYIYWYSRYADRKAVVVGDALPAIRLFRADGTEIGLDTFAGSPVVLLFYRGNWCPLCMAQVKEIAAEYQRLSELGVQVALISPQPHSQTQELAARFDVQFEFLLDRNNDAAKVLGIMDQGGTPAGLEALGYDSDTVMPTVYVLDAEGKVVFSHLTDNYRVRPEPSVFLSVLEEKGAL